MVPFADAFNHATIGTNECQLEGCAVEGLAFVMRAIRSVPAGHEIFNTYGPLPSARLLSSFGFVTGGHWPLLVKPGPRPCTADMISELR